MKRVLFIFDKVAHYHRELFKQLEQQLGKHGIELHLLSGQARVNAIGRVGVKESVVSKESKYHFKEFRVGTYTFRTQSGVLEKIRAVKPHVVVNMCHVGNATHWKITRLKKTMGFKLAAWQCGYEYHPGKLKGILLDRFIPHYDFHLAYHTNARDYAISHGALPAQITVMHNTINEEKITPMLKDEARTLITSRHPEIGDRKIILFVGAVLAEKRIETILQALDLMKRKDAVLVLVGDGEHMPIIRQLCANRTDVVLTGSVVEGVGPYFDAAEMYVLPGTGGLGINEAMAHNLPIISGFADGSADDLVVDGENGFRLRKGTPEELAGRMAELLDNPEIAKRMGDTSKKWITGKFAFREFISRIENALTTLVE